MMAALVFLIVVFTTAVWSESNVHSVDQVGIMMLNSIPYMVSFRNFERVEINFGTTDIENLFIQFQDAAKTYAVAYKTVLQDVFKIVSNETLEFKTTANDFQTKLNLSFRRASWKNLNIVANFYPLSMLCRSKHRSNITVSVYNFNLAHDPAVDSCNEIKTHPTYLVLHLGSWIAAETSSSSNSSIVLRIKYRNSYHGHQFKLYDADFRETMMDPFIVGFENFYVLSIRRNVWDSKYYLYEMVYGLENIVICSINMEKLYKFSPTTIFTIDEKFAIFRNKKSNGVDVVYMSVRIMVLMQIIKVLAAVSR